MEWRIIRGSSKNEIFNMECGSGGWGRPGRGNIAGWGIQPTKGNGHSEAKRRGWMRDEVRTTKQEQDGPLKIRRFNNQSRWE